jgi:hypothetical protein
MFCDAPALAHTLRLSQGRGLTVRPVCAANVVEGYVRGRSPAVRYGRSFGALPVVSPPEFERATHLNPATLYAQRYRWSINASDRFME